ncbi:MAG: sulfatase-like hydrolase/transferase [Spirochaetes bacterium]|nr:sulfatase-like hydrolase/transferase [Spirochaetota bacterium]
MRKRSDAGTAGAITRRGLLKSTGTVVGAGIAGLSGFGFMTSLLGAGDPPAHPAVQLKPRRGGRGRDGRPNLIFILGDNHNASVMGCAGHPFIKTPGLDRLASEGVLFDRAFNTTSLCSPSRASILTGMYACRHGVKNNHTHWTGEHSTFLQHLSDAGYYTAFIGKWHMPGRLPELPFLDLYVTYTYREGQGSYFNCPMLVNGREVPSRNYITGEVTDYALEFMEAVKSSDDRGPFCIYLSHRPAHPPFQSPAPFSGMYDREDVMGLLPPNVDPHWYGKTNRNVFQGIMMGSYYDQYRRYCETLTAMDRDIARLLEYLDRNRLADNTVVIYMGDNGMSWGAHDHHGIREPYEDVIRLPFIVRAPGIIGDPGSRRGQMVLNIDIAPTLLDLAGIGTRDAMDGVSILPVLRNPRGTTRDAFLLEFFRYYPEPTPTYRGIRTGSHKYIEFERGRDPWLFDLAADPGELHNIFGHAGSAPVVEGLRGRMAGLPSG